MAKLSLFVGFLALGFHLISADYFDEEERLLSLYADRLAADVDGKDLGPVDDVTLTYFLLFTPETGPDLDSAIRIDDVDDFSAELSTASFDPARKTIFLIHGFWSDEGFVDDFVADLLEKDDYNVIGVLWPELAKFPYFLQAGENAVAVGEYAGGFIADLIATTGLAHEDVHLVGHSYGAQASGHAGRSVYVLTGKKLNRITALEPAFPWFRLHDPSMVVSRDDAVFVDVWHTNSGRLIDACLSFTDALGHVDFYPSGGDHQPGCTDVCRNDDCNEYDLVDFLRGGCSHSRSHEYFVESINGNVEFAALRCDSYDDFQQGLCDGAASAEMGLDLSLDAEEGTYFLEVNDEAPFALG